MCQRRRRRRPVFIGALSHGRLASMPRIYCAVQPSAEREELADNQPLRRAGGVGAVAAGGELLARDARTRTNGVDRETLCCRGVTSDYRVVRCIF
ncbi:hypothetical protein EVAR_67750_1 [Eumeta japonica]|uniref:Uncharacterized protein n=1 Tax=Eumeta variegata TaxID=151549 RepID=A0A4C1ZK33_EUMVA|nr:hypothetical protein EVAR_67750_1 [Eumeta japonica]